MKVRFSSVPVLLVCLISTSFAQKWYTAVIDNATGRHTFENSVIRYDYFETPGGNNCYQPNIQCCTSDGCGECPLGYTWPLDDGSILTVYGPMGNGIINFIYKPIERDLCYVWAPAGTGFNLCDYSRAQITDFTEHEKYIEYKVTHAVHSRWERMYKGLPFLEKESISVKTLWLSDMMWADGNSPIMVMNGVKDVEGKGAGNSLQDQCDGRDTRGDCWVAKNGSSEEEVLYKGYLIMGMINKDDGIGTGHVVRMGSMYGMKLSWNHKGVVYVEWWDQTQRAVGSKYWYYPVTQGREELIRVGKALVDNGGVTDDMVSAYHEIKYGRLRREARRFNVSMEGSRLVVTLASAGQPLVSVFNTAGRRVATHNVQASGAVIDMSAMPAGIYFVHQRSRSGAMVKKVSVGGR